MSDDIISLTEYILARIRSLGGSDLSEVQIREIVAECCNYENFKEMHDRVLRELNGENVDEDTFDSRRLGAFSISSDGDLLVSLPDDVDNPYSINDDGDLIVESDTDATLYYSIDEQGNLIYNNHEED